MTRRRGPALEATILDAAWAELQAVGYAKVTMEGVAARARTGKQVLYRRWPNRAQLVVAAIRHVTGAMAGEAPNTGDLRTDVLAVLERMAERQRSIGSDVTHGLMADAPDLDPDFNTVMSGMMTAVLEQAADRGELVLGKLPPRVVSLPVSLLRHEMLLTSEPISGRTMAEIVDDVFLPLVRATAGTD